MLRGPWEARRGRQAGGLARRREAREGRSRGARSEGGPWRARPRGRQTPPPPSRAEGAPPRGGAEARWEGGESTNDVPLS